MYNITNMTAKIFHYDSYRRELTATIKQIEGNKIFLDRTIFYPTGGGQNNDTGFIENYRVNDVKSKGNDIIHYIEGSHNLKAGDRVKCKIDWNTRFANMQRHTGQHLLSAILFRDYSINTISSHLGNGYSTIDIERIENFPSLIHKIEERLNSLILGSKPVRAYIVNDKRALKGTTLRRNPKVFNNIRIVEIEGIDSTPCGGTHLRNTNEIWGIKIIKTEKYKGMWRLTFLAGGDYLNLADSLHKISKDIKEKINIPISEIKPKMEKLLYEVQRLEKSNRTLQALYIDKISDTIIKSRIQKESYDILSYLLNQEEIQGGITLKITSELIEEKLIQKALNRAYIIVIGEIRDKNLKILIKSNPENSQLAEEYFNKTKEMLNAKGGGRGNVYNLIVPNGNREDMQKILKRR